MRFDKKNRVKWRRTGCMCFLALLFILLYAENVTAAGSDFEISGSTLVRYNGSEADVTIPDGITAIHTSAFEGNKTIQYIHFPNTLEHIGDGAFNNCRNLRRVDFPDSLQVIGGLAFRDCDSLEEVSLSGGIRQIGAMAFKDCDELRTVTISSNVETIEYGVFSQCRNLQSIFVSSSNNNFSEKDGVLFNEDGTVLLQFPIGNKSTQYVIPQGTVTIGRDAFQESRVSRIIIPEGVEIIEWRAFDKCQGLETVDLPTTVRDIKDNAFSECVNLERIRIPSSNVEFGEQVFHEDPSVTIYGIKNSKVARYAEAESINFQDIENIPKETYPIDRRTAIALIAMLSFVFLILVTLAILLARSRRKQKKMVREIKSLRKKQESGEDIIGEFQEKLKNIESENEELKRYKTTLYGLRKDGRIQPKVVRSSYIQLFMISPYDEKYGILEEAVRKVFEDSPFFFEVRLARDYYDADTQMENVRKHIASAHGFIAEISDRNANVMMEIGGILMTGDSRPVFSLCLEECAGNVPSDLNGTLLFQYSNRYSSADELADQIRGLVIKDGRIRVSKLKQLMDEREQHYLSKVLLMGERFNISEQQANRICGKYMTVESLLDASTNELESFGVNKKVAVELKRLIEA